MAWSWKNIFGFGGDQSKGYAQGQADANSNGAINPTMLDTRNPDQKAIDQFLSGFITKYGPMYQPGKAYSGQLTAPMGTLENSGQDFLAQFLNAPNMSPNLTAASSLLNKNLTGGFDPKTSDFYSALRDEAKYNQGRAIDTTRQDLGARGKFFSTEALQKEGDINAQTTIGLNKDMATLADNERTRQNQSLALAQPFENFISNIPLNKATAAQTVGAYPRQLQQADFERQYQDFKRQQDELAGVVGDAKAGFGGNSSALTESFQAYQPQGSSGFDQYITPILQQLATKALMSAFAA